MKTQFFSLIISFLLLHHQPSWSQLPVKQWDACFGGTDNEDLRSLQQTADGGYVMAGSSVSGIGGNKSQDNNGGSDFWIVKTDVNGTKQWDADFGGNLDENLTSMQQTSDGGYILGGSSLSGISGDKSQVTKGELDFWIIKIDANGHKEWDASYGGDLEDELYSLQQTSDGGYILGGASESGVSGDKTAANLGLEDYWLIKVNANGVKLWDKSFGGIGTDEMHWLRQTSDGGFILGGKSESGISGNKTTASKGSIDYWVVKTNGQGQKQWEGDYGALSVDILFNLEQTTDGGYILGGYSLSGASGDKSQPTQGYSDYWLVKTDANGVKQWDARYGGSAGDAPYALVQTNDGGYLFAGRSESPVSGDQTQASKGFFDYWLVKTDGNGIKLWDERFGGLQNDELFGMQQTTDGGYILGGFSKSKISGDKSQNSHGLNDYWILKTTSGISCTAPVNLTTTKYHEFFCNSELECRTGSIELQVALQSNNNITMDAY